MKLQNLFPRLRVIVYDARKIEKKMKKSRMDCIFSVTSAKTLVLQMTENHGFLKKLLERNRQSRTFERILYLTDVA